MSKRKEKNETVSVDAFKMINEKLPPYNDFLKIKILNYLMYQFNKNPIR